MPENPQINKLKKHFKVHGENIFTDGYDHGKGIRLNQIKGILNALVTNDKLPSQINSDVFSVNNASTTELEQAINENNQIATLQGIVSYLESYQENADQKDNAELTKAIRLSKLAAIQQHMIDNNFVLLPQTLTLEELEEDDANQLYNHFFKGAETNFTIGKRPLRTETNVTRENIGSESDPKAPDYYGTFGHTEIAEANGRRGQQEDTLEVIHLSNTTLNENEGKLDKVIQDTLDELEDEVLQQNHNSGSTVNGAVIDEHGVTCFNVGDATTFVTLRLKDNSTRTIRLNELHKPTNEDEEERIKEADGFVLWGRVNGKLAVSRAIGDKDCKEGNNEGKTPVSKEATITHWNLEKLAQEIDPPILINDIKEMVVTTACDGLTDHVNQSILDDEWLNNRKLSDKDNKAKQLIEQALEAKSEDNVSVMRTAYEVSNGKIQTSDTTIQVVFDGHGGKQTSAHCAEHFASKYVSNLNKTYGKEFEVETFDHTKAGRKAAKGSNQSKVLTSADEQPSLVSSESRSENASSSSINWEELKKKFIKLSVSEEGGVNRDKRENSTIIPRQLSTRALATNYRDIDTRGTMQEAVNIAENGDPIYNANRMNDDLSLHQGEGPMANPQGFLQYLVKHKIKHVIAVGPAEENNGQKFINYIENPGQLGEKPYKLIHLKDNQYVIYKNGREVLCFEVSHLKDVKDHTKVELEDEHLAAINRVMEHPNEGHFVHCSAGFGRSGNIVLAIEICALLEKNPKTSAQDIFDRWNHLDIHVRRLIQTPEQFVGAFEVAEKLYEHRAELKRQKESSSASGDEDTADSNMSSNASDANNDGGDEVNSVASLGNDGDETNASVHSDSTRSSHLPRTTIGPRSSPPKATQRYNKKILNELLTATNNNQESISYGSLAKSETKINHVEFEKTINVYKTKSEIENHYTDEQAVGSMTFHQDGTSTVEPKDCNNCKTMFAHGIYAYLKSQGIVNMVDNKLVVDDKLSRQVVSIPLALSGSPEAQAAMLAEAEKVKTEIHNAYGLNITFQTTPLNRTHAARSSAAPARGLSKSAAGEEAESLMFNMPLPYEEINGVKVAPFKNPAIDPYGKLANTTNANMMLSVPLTYTEYDDTETTVLFPSSEHAFHATKILRLIERIDSGDFDTFLTEDESNDIRKELIDLLHQIAERKNEGDDQFLPRTDYDQVVIEAIKSKPNLKAFVEKYKKQKRLSLPDSMAKNFKRRSEKEKQESLYIFNRACKAGHHAQFAYKVDIIQEGRSYNYEGMKEVIRAKLTQDTKESRALKETVLEMARQGIIPLEVSSRDSTWATGSKGDGANQLGVIILEVGNELLRKNGERPAIESPSEAYRKLSLAAGDELKHDKLVKKINPNQVPNSGRFYALSVKYKLAQLKKSLSISYELNDSTGKITIKLDKLPSEEIKHSFVKLMGKKAEDIVDNKVIVSKKELMSLNIGSVKKLSATSPVQEPAFDAKKNRH